jgi:hypothetical protein
MERAACEYILAMANSDQERADELAPGLVGVENYERSVLFPDNMDSNMRLSSVETLESLEKVEGVEQYYRETADIRVTLSSDEPNAQELSFGVYVGILRTTGEPEVLLSGRK